MAAVNSKLDLLMLGMHHKYQADKASVHSGIFVLLLFIGG